MRGLVAVVLIAGGCGRIGFDPSTTDLTGDANRDGASGTADTLGCVLPAVQQSMLRAWWPAERLDDQGAVLVAPDISGYQNQGLCAPGLGTCPALTIGRTCATAYHFDGVDDRIDVADDPSLDFGGGAFTVSAWLLLEVAPGLRACAVTKTYATQFNNAWTICIEPDLRTHFYTIGNSVPHIQNSTAPITLGQWHHVAVEWSGTQKVTFIDGVSLASDVVSAVDFDTNDIHIGADVDAGNTSQQWTGKVADVRIYNEALSASDVATLAQ